MTATRCALPSRLVERVRLRNVQQAENNANLGFAGGHVATEPRCNLGLNSGSDPKLFS
jgi:prepilin-type processing-associated H-X9-DG protein